MKGLDLPLNAVFFSSEPKFLAWNPPNFMKSAGFHVFPKWAKDQWSYFCIVYPIDSFQDHMIWFWHCVPNWLLSRQVDVILALCTQLIPFKAIWANFIIVDQTDSFQDHLTWFLYCIPNWFLSRPFAIIYSLCTQLTPFKTIWPDFSILYPIHSLQDHMT